MKDYLEKNKTKIIVICFFVGIVIGFIAYKLSIG
tara:strand:+ start:795 stop:896 length:102 start_codon:yes stop_codon:yes gene_type:complete